MIQPELIKELQEGMSLTRLAKTGLFQRMNIDDSIIGDEEQRELRLHRAVLDRALIDSFSTVDRIREDVEKWLDIANQDFIICCDRADLNPGNVFDVFILIKEILKGRKARFTKFGEKSSIDFE